MGCVVLFDAWGVGGVGVVLFVSRGTVGVVRVCLTRGGWVGWVWCGCLMGGAFCL